MAVRSMMLRRVKVPLIEFIICSMLSLFFWGLGFLNGMYSLSDWIFAWLLTNLGPLVPLVLLPFMWSEATRTATPITESMSVIGFVIGIAILAMPVLGVGAYLLRPGRLTGALSFIGVAVWFLIGCSMVGCMIT